MPLAASRDGYMSLQMWERRYLLEATTRKDIPSIFASEIVNLLPSSSIILELGAGRGCDSRFFASLGHHVVSTDIASSALKFCIRHTSDSFSTRITFVSFDLRSGFPFHSNSFDVVYAHLCLHYFDRLTTLSISDEVYRVLKCGGIFAFLVNSVNDPEHCTQPEIETDLFLVKEEDGEGPKRYFSINSTRPFVNRFETVILDDKGEADFKATRGIHNLIRFVGVKN